MNETNDMGVVAVVLTWTHENASLKSVLTTGTCTSAVQTAHNSSHNRSDDEERHTSTEMSKIIDGEKKNDCDL
jgi:hypothetical protein